MTSPILHSYFRSSASYRVRIVLALKGMAWHTAGHRLLEGEQRAPEFLAINPQGLVPALEIDGAVLSQSYAICEYLDETRPEPPLLPADPVLRARVRAFALAIACEIHPLQNLGVLNRLRAIPVAEDAVKAWARDVIERGFEACAAMIADQPGPWCFGDRITLADVFLVPQMANARRFKARCDWGRLESIEAACLAHPAFAAAHPDAQPDAA